MTRPIPAEPFVSLDLVVDEPREWHFPWVGPQMLAELRLRVHPIQIGSGRRVFDNWHGRRIAFDLAESTPDERGARLDVYRPHP